MHVHLAYTTTNHYHVACLTKEKYWFNFNFQQINNKSHKISVQFFRTRQNINFQIKDMRLIYTSYVWA